LSQPHDWTISTLDEKYKKGKLNLQAAYQREYVWKLRPELPSRLIESLLLEIPIPPLYFGKIADGALEVIDGQQRCLIRSRSTGLSSESHLLPNLQKR
jgi:uncharacterized protein with ParB-like and HNH nuclease domain